MILSNKYFRFAKWIKEQELPKELKGDCKNVLNSHMSLAYFMPYVFHKESTQNTESK